MPKPEVEIVVEDPGAPADDSPALTSTRAVDIAVAVLLLGLAVLLACDNGRTGMSWDSTGPQNGYFPFYLPVILAAACLYGLVKEFKARRLPDEPFVLRAQFWRLLHVFMPSL